MLVSHFPLLEAIPLDWYFSQSISEAFYNNNNACGCDTAAECYDCDYENAQDTYNLNVNNNSSLSRKRRGRQTTFHRVCAHPCLRLNLSPLERQENFVSAPSPPLLSRARNHVRSVSAHNSDTDVGRMGTGASHTKSPARLRASVCENREANTKVTEPSRPPMAVRNDQLILPQATRSTEKSANNNASAPRQKRKDNSGKETATVPNSSAAEAPSASNTICTCVTPVHRKQPTDPPTYEAYGSLKAIFGSTGRELDYVQGDGNCFFRALSKEIYGSEDCHYELRQAILDLMSRHRAEFEQYTDTCTQSFSSHIEEMRQFANWATTAEIYGASTLLQRDIYVFSPDHTGTQYSWLHFSPCFPHNNDTNSACPQCYMTLCHTNGNHYDRVTPLNGSCNCALPPPELSGESHTVNVVQENSNSSLYTLNEADENRSDRTKTPGE